LEAGLAHFERHCKDCEAILGDRHEGVNKWMDELFSKFGPNHREWRHHWRGVWEAKKVFGPEGAKAAIVHIVRDCGAVPKARDYGKTNLGIVVAPAFLIAPAKEGEQPEEEFLAAVAKAMKKAKGEGVFEGG
jgi:hypothetical protein